MTKIFVSAEIDAPVEKVWAQVRDFNNMPDWHPKFSRSHIEECLPSDRIGCVRNFDIAGGGGTIRERLLELSDIEFSFRYCILTSPLPVEGYVAQLTLYPVTVGDRRFELQTAVSYNPEERLDIPVVQNGSHILIQFTAGVLHAELARDTA